LDEELNGNRSKQEVGEFSPPTVRSRMRVAAQGNTSALYGPTETHRESLEIAIRMYRDIRDKIVGITDNRIPALEKQLMEAGAPWIEGQPLPEK
jgi:nitroreductase